jgi:hypothetical protein
VRVELVEEEVLRERVLAAPLEQLVCLLVLEHGASPLHPLPDDRSTGEAAELLDDGGARVEIAAIPVLANELAERAWRDLARPAADLGLLDLGSAAGGEDERERRGRKPAPPHGRSGGVGGVVRLAGEVGPRPLGAEVEKCLPLARQLLASVGPRRGGPGLRRRPQPGAGRGVGVEVAALERDEAAQELTPFGG